MRAVPINSWAEFIQILSQLKKNAKEVELKLSKGEEASTAYETIVIDVADIAYDLCEKYILSREGVETVKDIPFGAGYGMIEKEFDERMRSIVQMGYSLILISHETFINPEEENGAKKATPTLSKRPKKICSRLVDNFVHIAMETTPDGTLERVMHFRETPEWEAGSRFRYMPESCPLGYNNYKEAVLEAIKKMEEEDGEEYVTAAYVNNYSVSEVPNFDDIMGAINKQISDIMAIVEDNGSESELVKAREQIVRTIEKRLGQGRKLNNATEAQIEQLILLQDDFSEILNK